MFITGEENNDLAFTSGSTTAWTLPGNISLESIFTSYAHIDRIMKEFPNVIKIWKGDPGDDLLHAQHYLWSLPLAPILRCSDLIRGWVCYMIAGFGIVAGSEAFKTLSQLSMELVWSDEYIALEDQDNDIARMLVSWAKKSEEKND